MNLFDEERQREAQAYAEMIRTTSYWRGLAAGALAGECTPLHDLTAEQRADPEFMRGWREDDRTIFWDKFWVGDDV